MKVLFSEAVANPQPNGGGIFCQQHKVKKVLSTECVYKMKSMPTHTFNLWSAQSKSSVSPTHHTFNK